MRHVRLVTVDVVIRHFETCAVCAFAKKISFRSQNYASTMLHAQNAQNYASIKFACLTSCQVDILNFPFTQELRVFTTISEFNMADICQLTFVTRSIAQTP